jgi:hypothetical protein
MKHTILSTTVEEVYQNLDPETDLRDEAFYEAVLDMVKEKNLIDVSTDGIDVVVTAEDEGEQTHELHGRL